MNNHKDCYIISYESPYDKNKRIYMGRGKDGKTKVGTPDINAAIRFGSLRTAYSAKQWLKQGNPRIEKYATVIGDLIKSFDDNEVKNILDQYSE